MQGFIIKKPWADLIMDGMKTWEIRGCNCKIRGTVGLVAEGKWIGTVDIVDCKELSPSMYKRTKSKHQVMDTKNMPYKNTFAWIMENATLFDKPKKYTHKNGCVIWVKL